MNAYALALGGLLMLGGRLAGLLGTRRLPATGGALAALGIAGFAATAQADGTFLTSILGPSLVSSVGIGMCFVPLGTAATTDVVPGETGMASGLLNSSRQVGGSLGLAVLVTVAAQVTGGATGRDEVVRGYAAAFWVAAGLLAPAALAAPALLPRARTAEPVTESVSVPVADSVSVPVADPENSQKNSAGGVDPAVSRSTQG